jgi:hypothetical protein
MPSCTLCLTATGTDSSGIVAGFSGEKPLTWKEKVTDLNFHCYTLIFRGELAKHVEAIRTIEAQILRGTADRQVTIEGLASDTKAEYFRKVAAWTFERGVLSAPTEFYRPDLVDLSPVLQVALKANPILSTALKCHFAVVGLQKELVLNQAKKDRIEAQLALMNRHMKNHAHFERGLKEHSNGIVREFISNQYSTSPEDFFKVEEKVSGATELPGLIRPRLIAVSEDGAVGSSTRVYYGETQASETWYAVKSLEEERVVVDYFVERPHSWYCWDHAKDTDGTAKIFTLLQASSQEATRRAYPLLPSLMVPPRVA